MIPNWRALTPAARKLSDHQAVLTRPVTKAMKAYDSFIAGKKYWISAPVLHREVNRFHGLPQSRHLTRNTPRMVEVVITGGFDAT